MGSVAIRAATGEYPRWFTPGRKASSHDSPLQIFSIRVDGPLDGHRRWLARLWVRLQAGLNLEQFQPARPHPVRRSVWIPGQLPAARTGTHLVAGPRPSFAGSFKSDGPGSPGPR